MKLCLRCNNYFSDDILHCPNDGVALEVVGKDPLIGALINHRYAVESVVGKGASGIVYKATRLRMGSAVAIKVVHSYLGADPKSLEKFTREVSALENLRHPNIVSLWESGVTDDGQPYLVMDYLEGTALSSLLAQHNGLAPSRVLDITKQVCGALKEAHAQGFVHRDIKPENIVLENTSSLDFVKICDFGIAYTAFENRLNAMSRPTTVAGSPAYMSPEQCRGLPLDHRADIYSLGLVVFEMITGKKPFMATTSKEYMIKTVNEKLPKMGDIRPDLNIPEMVEHIVSKALMKNPKDRFDAIVDFSNNLTAACEASGFASIKGMKQSGDDRLQNPSTRVSERLRGQS
ncbi:MAG: serine/threonine protein kinase [Cyanobacteria bacterium REEB67]|nr:serine/threonine protein kinase [Cyanobacteria bacterium REEB67]